MAGHAPIVLVHGAFQSAATWDLVAPRLRESGRGSFLLESVERGRLGRHSFVGFGSRLLDFADAEVFFG